jgi:hypothetical protein
MRSVDSERPLTNLSHSFLDIWFVYSKQRRTISKLRLQGTPVYSTSIALAHVQSATEHYRAPQTGEPQNQSLLMTWEIFENIYHFADSCLWVQNILLDQYIPGII